MGCFLLIPAGAVILTWSGHAILVDRYWTMVMGAEFAAFAPLAFIQTRPPWALERKPQLADPAIHRNIHTIRVEADAARFTMTIENVPSVENPRTGRITALSILACLRGLVSTLKVGT